MTTRFVAFALTAATLALGSAAALADPGIPSTWQGVAPSEPQAGQTQINNPHPQYESQQDWQRGRQWQQQQWQRQRDQQWQRGQEARRDHDRRERYEHRERDHRHHGWQQPAYVYGQSGYVYGQPDYVYQQPAYVYQQGYAYPPGYYQQPSYDNSDAAGNLVIGTIIGGLIGGAIAH